MPCSNNSLVTGESTLHFAHLTGICNNDIYSWSTLHCQVAECDFIVSRYDVINIRQVSYATFRFRRSSPRGFSDHPVVRVVLLNISKVALPDRHGRTKSAEKSYGRVWRIIGIGDAN